MKNIIQFNPSLNIESHFVVKTDIILVYLNGEPIGYVHQNNGFSLHANYFIDDSGDVQVGIENLDNNYKTLADLMNDYPELQFKIVE